MNETVSHLGGRGWSGAEVKLGAVVVGAAVGVVVVGVGVGIAVVGVGRRCLFLVVVRV